MLEHITRSLDFPPKRHKKHPMTKLFTKGIKHPTLPSNLEFCSYNLTNGAALPLALLVPPLLVRIFYPKLLALPLKLSSLCWYIITTGIICGFWMRWKLNQEKRKKIDNFEYVNALSSSFLPFFFDPPSSLPRCRRWSFDSGDWAWAFLSNEMPWILKKLRRKRKRWQRSAGPRSSFFFLSFLARVCSPGKFCLFSVKVARSWIKNFYDRE